MREPRTIDWDSLRERMEATLRPSSEREQNEELERLEKRTRALAARIEPPTERENDLELVPFRLANETYTLESRFVLEVVRMSELTLVPGLPEFIRGVINFRGDVLMVVDLQRLLGVPMKGPVESSRVIICGRDVAEIGLVADQAEDLIRLSTDRVMDAMEVAPSISSELIRGVTADATLIVDASLLFRDERLYVNQRLGGV